jgi:phospholipid-binding lipoprotein MlaA
MKAAHLIGNCALALALYGCAAQNVSIRSLPPQTPAADNAAAIENAQTIGASSSSAPGGAAASAAPGASDQDTANASPPLTAADAPSMYTYDPWARLNRFTYRFNARFDEAIFLPVSNGYRRLPSPVRAGIHNFFGNLAEIDSVIDYTLQWRLAFGARSLGRFVINSTLGLGGLFDVAAKFKLARAPTDFGTTLAMWGMHPGPYLVIPLLGPSTLRGSVGLLADFGASYAINIGGLYRGDESWGLDVADGVDQRSNVSFRYYATGSPFEYETIRFLYVRKQLIEDEGLHAKDVPKKRDAGVPAGK